MKRSFEMQSQHSFAFESSRAQQKCQLQVALAEHAAATLRTQSQRESEVKALRSQLEAQARRALASHCGFMLLLGLSAASQKQHEAAMSACQAHLPSAHIAELS